MDQPPSPQTPSRFFAVLRQRCPRCLAGNVFTGPFAMNRNCPACGLQFAREPGYFLGAMYFGYGFGSVVLGLLLLLAWLLFPGWALHQLLLMALFGFIPFLPIVFRYSRICWLHFDHIFDPQP